MNDDVRDEYFDEYSNPEKVCHRSASGTVEPAKSDWQTITAFLMLGGGFGMTVCGIFVAFDTRYQPGRESAWLWKPILDVLIGGGVVSVLLGIAWLAILACSFSSSIDRAGSKESQGPSPSH